MKYFFFISAILLIAQNSRAQVGINTDPQALPNSVVFKVDGGNTPSNSADDFIVNSNGNVGIGVDSPSAALHIKTTNGKALQIKDNQAEAGKILVSDVHGYGTWQNIDAGKISKLTLILGKLSETDVTITPKASDTYRFYTGVYIDLPPGHWEVNMNFYIQNENRMNFDTNSKVPWIRAIFTNNINANTAPGTLFSTATAKDTPDFIDGTNRAFLFGGILHGPSAIDSDANTRRLMPFQGKVLLINKTTATKRYYLMTRDSSNGTPVIKNFGAKSVDGNLIYAVPFKA